MRLRSICPMAAVAALILGSLLAGCGGTREDPILALSSEEALRIGKELLEKKKFTAARRHLTHAFEAEPNSPGGREALLLAADTYFVQGGAANLIQAESKYRDFLNRFPTSPKAPYVQFQMARSLEERIKKADRDQSVTEKAEQAYREVLQLYPASEYAARAREQIHVVRDRLAQHELGVGRFYMRYGLPISAIQRFTGLLETFPEYSGKDEVYYYLGVAYKRNRQPLLAVATFSKLRREFPESELVAEIPEVDVSGLAAQEEGGEGEKASSSEDGDDRESNPDDPAEDPP